MSQYSEIMGSFIRTGNYPLEANYIFNSEAALKEFFADEVNVTTLHQGLFKVVAEEDKQTLYWVVKNGETLEFKPLLESNSLEQFTEAIAKLKEDLEQEQLDRELSDEEILGSTELLEDLDNIYKLSLAIVQIQEENKLQQQILQAICGTDQEDLLAYLNTLDYPTLSTISKEIKAIYGDPAPNINYNSLRKLQEVITQLASITKNRTDNLQTELDQTQSGIGLSSDGSYSPDQETTYLKNATSVMNALKVLDSKIKEILLKKDLQFSNTSTIEFDIRDSIVTANAKLDSDPKNQLIIKGTEGLYFNLSAEYESGTLTLKVNDNILNIINLGIGTLVQDAFYDPIQENLVIKFDESNIIKINVGALIREWDIINSSPIILSRKQVIDGPDEVSADVKLSNKSTNILKIVDNSLLVDGTTDNIVHDGIQLSVVLTSLTESLQQEISNTASEISTIKSNLSKLESSTTNLVNEAVDLINADLTTIQSKIETLQSNTQALGNSITNEAVLRKSGDDNLNTRIDALDTKLSTLQSLINTNTVNITAIDNRLLLVQQQIENIIQLQRTHGWYEE